MTKTASGAQQRRAIIFVRSTYDDAIQHDTDRYYDAIQGQIEDSKQLILII